MEKNFFDSVQRNAGNKQTELVSGDLYFTNGSYKQRINIKSANGVANLGQRVNLRAYTDNERWENPAIQFGVTAITAAASSTIYQYAVDIVMHNDNQEFEFVGTVNNTATTDGISVSWYAREDITNFTGDSLYTTESKNRTVEQAFTLSKAPTVIISESVNSGLLTRVAWPGAGNQSITYRCENGVPYKRYPLSQSHTIGGMLYSENPPDSVYLEVLNHYTNDVVGNLDYSGNIPKTGEDKIIGGWVAGNEYVHIASTTSTYAEGAILDSLVTLDREEQVRVIRCVHVSTVEYQNYYDIVCVREARDIRKNVHYSGSIYASSYMYIIKVKYES